MKLVDKIYMENYYINNPIKFYTKPKKIRDFFIAGMEIIKIILAKLHLLKWSFNERAIERPFVFQNLPKSGRVLDIGCSDSIMPIEIASLGYETYSNDLKNYPFKHPNLKFIRGDALKLNFSDNFFDAITCISTLEHVGLSKDYSGTTKLRKDRLLIEKIRKMLKKKGVLIITIPFGTSKVLENLHTRVYDSKEASLLFSGFNVKEERYFYQRGENWFSADADFLEKLTKPQNLKNFGSRKSSDFLGSRNVETVAMFVLEKI